MAMHDNPPAAGDTALERLDRALDAPLPRDVLGARLNRVVRDSLRPVTLALGLLYLCLGLIYAVAGLGPDGMRLAALNAGLGAVCLGLFLVLGRWELPPRWAHPLSILLVCVALTAAAARHLTFDWEIVNSFALLMIVMGVFFLDPRWWAVANALVVTVWFFVWKQDYPAVSGLEFVILLVASLVLSRITSATRRQALVRVERARLAEAAYIHALQQAARRAQASEERFQRLADATFEGIVVHDGLTILDANRALLEMFGVALEDMIGQPVLDFITPETRAMALEKVRERAERPYEVMALRPDGTTFPIEICGRTFKEDGHMVRVVAVRDITEHKRAEAEREQLIAELEAFAHTVAHDLKNPLNIVLVYSELLRDELDDLPPEQLSEYVHGLTRGAQKMERIIDELLVLAQTRQSDVKCTVLNMPLIVAEVCRMLAPVIDETGAEIVLAEHWPEALGVASWVEHVWMNYLSNAIKYGGRPPRIELGADLRPDAPGMVRFWVRDNGPGLSPAQQEVIFHPFARLGAGMQGGHGLGLSIVRRIVTRLGGQVGVESAPGQGARFYFTLPPAPPDLRPVLADEQVCVEESPES